MSFTSRLTIRAKLFLIVGLLMVPIVLFGAYILQTLRDELAVISDEKEGLAALRTVWPVLEARALQPVAGPSNATAALNGLAATPFAGCAEGVGTAPRAYQGVIVCIGQQSGLLADAGYMGSKLANQMVRALPELMTRLEAMMASAQSVGAKETLNPFDRMAFLVSAGGFKATADGLSAETREDAEMFTTALAAVLQAPGEAYRGANGAYQGAAARVANAIGTEASGAAVDLAPLEAAYGELISASGALWLASADALDAALTARADGLMRHVMVATAILALTVVLAFILSFAMSRSIVMAIRGLDSRIRQIADDDATGREFPEARCKDEIAQIARAVTYYRDRTIEKIEAREREARAVIDQRNSRVEALVSAFETCSGDLLASVDNAMHAMGNTAETLNGIAAHADEKAVCVSGTSEDAADNVKRVAEASEDLAHAMAEVSAQAVEATRVVDAAAADATEANAEIETLSKAAQSIGEIVSLIEAIAEQTNLLALNATIEAARAGEHGRGFGVVAEEVKTLATQTADATAKVTSRVAEIQDQTGKVASAMDMIRQSMGNVTGLTSSIAGALDEKRASTQDISVNVSAAAEGAVAVSSEMSAVKDAAHKTSEAAVDVRRNAADVGGKTQALRQEVDAFLKQVAAA